MSDIRDAHTHEGHQTLPRPFGQGDVLSVSDSELFEADRFLRSDSPCGFGCDSTADEHLTHHWNADPKILDIADVIEFQIPVV